VLPVSAVIADEAVGLSWLDVIKTTTDMIIGNITRLIMKDGLEIVRISSFQKTVLVFLILILVLLPV